MKNTFTEKANVKMLYCVQWLFKNRYASALQGFFLVVSYSVHIN